MYSADNLALHHSPIRDYGPAQHHRLAYRCPGPDPAARLRIDARADHRAPAHLRALIDPHRRVQRDIRSDLRARLESMLERGEDPASDPQLKGEISRYSISTVCDKRELFWRAGLSKFRIRESLGIMARHFVGRRSR